MHLSKPEIAREELENAGLRIMRCADMRLQVPLADYTIHVL